MQRKLRKACSLPTCSQRIGQCMHCTCDGRCGQHEPGMCGVSREGNGKACKQIGCTRDSNCLHSTRATCCQCRNLIATKSSSAANAALVDRSRQKRRAMAMKTSKMQPIDNYPIKKVKGEDGSFWGNIHPIMDENAECDPNTPYMDDILELLALDMEDIANDTQHMHVISDTRVHSRRRNESPPSLWECEAWQARKSSCNLVIVVDNIQFFVHKMPVLLESKTLERYVTAKTGKQAIEDNYAESSVPVIHLQSDFPGDAHLFEQLCIYWYTGVLPASLLTSTSCSCSLNKLPVLVAAMEYLELSTTVQKRVQNLFNVLTKGQSLEPLVCFMNHIQDLTDTGLVQSTPAMQELLSICIQALISKVQSLTVNDITSLMTLPNDIFSMIIQQMMSRSNEVADQNLARMLKEGRITKHVLANWNNNGTQELSKSVIDENMDSCFMEANWGITSDPLLQSPSGIDMSFVENSSEALQLSLASSFVDTAVSNVRSIANENWASDSHFSNTNRMISFHNGSGTFAV